MSKDPNQATPKEIIKYPDTPKKHIEECVSKLKSFQETLSIDDINYLILRRVIKDIQYTSTKIC